MAYAFNELLGTNKDGTRGRSPLLGGGESVEVLTEDLVRHRISLLRDELALQIDELREIRTDPEAINEFFKHPGRLPDDLTQGFAETQVRLFRLARIDLGRAMNARTLEDLLNAPLGSARISGRSTGSGSRSVKMPSGVIYYHYDSMNKSPIVTCTQPSNCQVDWR